MVMATATEATVLAELPERLHRPLVVRRKPGAHSWHALLPEEEHVTQLAMEHAGVHVLEGVRRYPKEHVAQAVWVGSWGSQISQCAAWQLSTHTPFAGV